MKKGLTIIELMVVISAIALLSAISIPKLTTATADAKVAEVQSNLANIRTAIKMHYVVNDSFPHLEGNQNDLGTFSEIYTKSKLPTTPAFEGISEDNTVHSTRDSTGGWLYFNSNGDFYANLPNGAYTLDEDEEIWDGELITVQEAIEIASNPSFEGFTFGYGWRLFDAGTVDGWETTATDNKIEAWKSGFLGVDAADGDYFVELNANQVASLYQEVETEPGDIVSWSVSHRGRTGTDTATISVGDEVLETMVTDNDGWVTYSGTYEVPEGQTTTRFSLDSVDSASSRQSVGNLIDNFSVTIN